MTAHPAGAQPTPPTPPTPSPAVNPPPDVMARLADCMADLADTLGGIRASIDHQIAKDDAADAARDERNRRREPLEWEAALRNLRDGLRTAVHAAVSGGGEVPVGAEGTDVQAFVDRLLPQLDAQIRASWTLRQALDTLSAQSPPEDPRAIAERIARQQLGATAAPEQVEGFIEAWLAGATYYERGE